MLVGVWLLKCMYVCIFMMGEEGVVCEEKRRGMNDKEGENVELELELGLRLTG